MFTSKPHHRFLPHLNSILHVPALYKSQGRWTPGLLITFKQPSDSKVANATSWLPCKSTIYAFKYLANFHKAFWPGESTRIIRQQEKHTASCYIHSRLQRRKVLQSLLHNSCFLAIISFFGQWRARLSSSKWICIGPPAIKLLLKPFESMFPTFHLLFRLQTHTGMDTTMQ